MSFIAEGSAICLSVFLAVAGTSRDGTFIIVLVSSLFPLQLATLVSARVLQLRDDVVVRTASPVLQSLTSGFSSMSADFWAGYISGAAGIVVGNPLDLIKVRVQAGGGTSSIHPTSITSIWQPFDRAGTLVRGATAPVLGYGALNALLFVTYNRSLSLIANGSTPSYAAMYMAGVAGGIASFVVSAPTELIKVRAQIAEADGRGSFRAGTSSLSIAKHVWRTEGIRGLYHGGGITAVRDAVGYGWYFCAYDYSKSLFATPGDPAAQNLSAWKILLCGGIAGCVSWASIFPLDVIKTRVQSQEYLPRPRPHSSSSPSHSPLLASETASDPRSAMAKRPSSVAVAVAAYRTEGLSVFFRGLGVCSVRAFIVNAVQWAVYEWAMAALRPKDVHRGTLNEVLKA